MRYQDWDVLVFPDVCKIPLQEFKTSCHVVPDPESHGSLNNPFLLPTVTSFIPSLSAGDAFRISIHCWQNPEISRYVRLLSKPSDDIVFEARLFVDGRIVGSKWFNHDGPWPSVIELSIDLNKNGDFEKLKFPTFHKELLLQNYWNPGDDLGRIKVVIAEGFSRDNMTYPFERIKNIVSFSFQHAPLDVLETSCIAWPNATMWRQVPLLAPYLAQQVSPKQSSDGVETHSHSPRHGPAPIQPPPPIASLGPINPPNVLAYPRQSARDLSTEAEAEVEQELEQEQPPVGWHRPRRASSTADVSMPDYSKPNTGTNSSRHVTDPMVVSENERSERRFQSLQNAGAYESVCEALSMPSAPSNTPVEPTPVAATRTSSGRFRSPFKAEPTETDPIGELIINSAKSQKENVQDHCPFSELSSATHEGTGRRNPQPFSTTSSGTKRQRIASKVIDVEDEPRSSPSLRKISRGNTIQDGNECEKRILGEIENIR